MNSVKLLTGRHSIKEPSLSGRGIKRRLLLSQRIAAFILCVALAVMGFGLLSAVYVFNNASLQGFFSFHLETANTLTPFNETNGDFTGNVVYYPDAGDTITGSWVSLLYNMTPGEATTYLYPPANKNQIISTTPQLIFLDDSGVPYTEQFLAERGYTFKLRYSTDAGTTFNDVPPAQLADIDVIALIMSKATDATTVETENNPLWVIAGFELEPTQPEAVNSQTLLTGWRIKLHTNTNVNSPVGVYVSSPTIDGFVRSQSNLLDEAPDWESATELQNQRVELIDVDGIPLAETTTEADGSFHFSAIPSLKALQIRVAAPDGPTYSFDGTEFTEQDTLSVGSVADIDRTFNSLTNVTWKVDEFDLDAALAKGSRFLVPTPADNQTGELPGTEVVPGETATPEGGLAKTGDNTPLKAGILLLACLAGTIILFMVRRYQKTLR